jgi:hypothetical protein
VGEHRPFGAAGGAGGVENDGDIAVVQGDAFRRRMRAELVEVDLIFLQFAFADHDHMFQAGQQRAQRFY